MSDMLSCVLANLQIDLKTVGVEQNHHHKMVPLELDPEDDSAELT